MIDHPGYSDLSTINFEAKAYSFRCSDIHNTTSLQAVPRPSGLRCMYMTNEPGWKGEGLNLCTESGQCSGQLPDGLTSQVSSAGASEDSRCYLYRSVTLHSQCTQATLADGPTVASTAPVNVRWLSHMAALQISARLVLRTRRRVSYATTLMTLLGPRRQLLRVGTSEESHACFFFACTYVQGIQSSSLVSSPLVHTLGLLRYMQRPVHH